MAGSPLLYIYSYSLVISPLTEYVLVAISLVENKTLENMSLRYAGNTVV